MSQVFEQNAKFLAEKDVKNEKNNFNLTISKNENFCFNSSSTKNEKNLTENFSTNHKMKKIPFCSNIINDIINKNGSYLNTETPQKIERFKSLDAFPFAKKKESNKIFKNSNIDDTNKNCDLNHPKSTIINNFHKDKGDFFYNVDQNKLNDIRKYKFLGINLSNSNNKVVRAGNSLNEKSLTKKSFESKKNVNNAVNNTKTKRIAYIEFNKDNVKKK